MAWLSKKLPRLFPALVGGLLGLVVGLVVSLKALGLPLVPGYAIETRYMEVVQKADAQVVSAREVARDVATSAVLPALTSTSASSTTWNVAWLGDKYLVIVASAPEQTSAEACVEVAKETLAQAVVAHNTNLESYELQEITPDDKAVFDKAVFGTAAVLVDRFAATVLIAVGVGALFGCAVWHVRRAYEGEGKQL